MPGDRPGREAADPARLNGTSRPGPGGPNGRPVNGSTGPNGAVGSSAGPPTTGLEAPGAADGTRPDGPGPDAPSPRPGNRPPNSRTVRPANARKNAEARKQPRKPGAGPRPLGAHTSTAETGPAYGPGGAPSAARRDPNGSGRLPNGRPRPGSGRGNEPAGPTGSQMLFANLQQGSAPSPLESTGPFPIVIPPETPPREQSRLVIFGVVAVLVLGLIVAAFSLRDFGGNSGPSSPTDGITPLASAPVTAPTQGATTPSAGAVPSATPSATPTTTAAPVVSAIRAIDPQGDGDEDSADSPKAVDGKSSTEWRSDTYSTAEFGGLKHGIGLALRLKSSTVVRSVTIHLKGSGGAVELRTASGPDYSGSTPDGKASIDSGSVTVQAAGDQPTRYVILWFTKLPSVSGNYRLEVSEVNLS